jgi:hypothetical protein
MADPMKNTPAQQAMLKTILEQIRPRITEEEFKVRYLPIIANVNGRYQEIETYIANVAKNYDAEVDLVDEHGNVVFVVPPISLPYPTEIGYKNSDAIATLIDRVEHTRALSPPAAERLLSEMLPARHDYQMTSETVKNYRTEAMRRWDALFDRYGYPRRFFKDGGAVNTENTSSSQPAKQELADDDIETL